MGGAEGSRFSDCRADPLECAKGRPENRIRNALLLAPPSTRSSVNFLPVSACMASIRSTPDRIRPQSGTRAMYATPEVIARDMTMVARARMGDPQYGARIIERRNQIHAAVIRDGIRQS